MKKQKKARGKREIVPVSEGLSKRLAAYALAATAVAGAGLLGGTELEKRGKHESY